jgi:hypothetical protein
MVGAFRLKAKRSGSELWTVTQTAPKPVSKPTPQIEGKWSKRCRSENQD